MDARSGRVEAVAIGSHHSAASGRTAEIRAGEEHAGRGRSRPHYPELRLTARPRHPSSASDQATYNCRAECGIGCALDGEMRRRVSVVASIGSARGVRPPAHGDVDGWTADVERNGLPPAGRKSYAARPAARLGDENWLGGSGRWGDRTRGIERGRQAHGTFG